VNFFGSAGRSEYLCDGFFLIACGLYSVTALRKTGARRRFILNTRNRERERESESESERETFITGAVDLLLLVRWIY